MIERYFGSIGWLALALDALEIFTGEAIEAILRYKLQRGLQRMDAPMQLPHGLTWSLRRSSRAGNGEPWRAPPFSFMPANNE